MASWRPWHIFLVFPYTYRPTGMIHLQLRCSFPNSPNSCASTKTRVHVFLAEAHKIMWRVIFYRNRLTFGGLAARNLYLYAAVIANSKWPTDLWPLVSKSVYVQQKWPTLRMSGQQDPNISPRYSPEEVSGKVVLYTSGQHADGVEEERFSVVIRRQRWKRFRLFCGLSVCLSRSCIVLKWQKISTRFFYIRQPYVSTRSRWNLAYVGQRRKPNCSKVAPCSFRRERHSMANCGRMVTHSVMVTMENL